MDKIKNDTEEKIASTLKNWSKDLSKWNKTKFENVDRCNNEVGDKIEKIRSLDINNRSIEIELELTKKLEDVLNREENLWRQKSRETWLKDGDKNTKFFHASTMHKRKINKIEKTKNDNSECLSSREAIGNELYSNLSNIWTSDISNDLNSIKEFIKPCISPEDII